ncbi:MAG: HU family DNA-binding protein [Geobacter sp.]|nr:HU family DNA-binding protein [Geobacter sp.]
MTRLELIKAIAVKTELPTTMVDRFLKAFMATISETLANGDIVRLMNFMTLRTSKRAARKGQSPQTGKKIVIPAATVPKVKFGKGLKEAVNGG